MTSNIKIPKKILKPLIEYLQNEKVKLRKRMEDFGKADPFNRKDRVNDNAVDTDAAEEVDHDRVAALQVEVEKTLIRIKKTLTKINVGKYGLCEGCGKLINTDRLAVDPTASLCIKCTKKKDNK